jgi:hypothetical protein
MVVMKRGDKNICVAGIFLGVKGDRRARNADNLTAICEPIVQKMWEP